MKYKTSPQPPVAKMASGIRGYDQPQKTLQFDTTEQLTALIQRYQERKKPVSINFRRLLPELKSVNRLTHLIHPYPAKLLTHIPIFFISNNLLSKSGDIIFDPFCGSGTVMLEAQIANRQAYGSDSNPLARLITRVKTTPIDAVVLSRTLKSLLKRIPNEPSSVEPEVVNLKHWFYPRVAIQLLPPPVKKLLVLV